MFIGKLLVALIVPFALMAGLSRFSLSKVVGLIATIGILMAVFEAYSHGPVILGIGTLSLFAGYLYAQRLLKNQKLTE
ncbi:DUF2198 family protein [Ammoniphilus sp. YIM 78166]|uniref:DUF2198 family protein n=1 Tax=Ammoniphilus sp. YIM 78166 TaxID=1644106 RepID=UPI0010702134|nr:DUF2198 family protein [Ammoniphilus sp. YIM 78166]